MISREEFLELAQKVVKNEETEQDNGVFQAFCVGAMWAYNLLEKELQSEDEKIRKLLSAMKTAVGYEPFEGSLHPRVLSEAIAEYLAQLPKEE